MKFKDEYFFLSNFYSERPLVIPIEGNNIIFHSAETAFWAQKDPSKAKYFSLLKPLEAKNYARDYVKATEDWPLRQVVAMANVLHIKFQDIVLLSKLCSIKEPIVNDNFWKDTFWGVHKGEGKNYLGKMLTCIRDSRNDITKLENLVKEIISEIRSEVN